MTKTVKLFVIVLVLLGLAACDLNITTETTTNLSSNTSMTASNTTTETTTNITTNTSSTETTLTSETTTTAIVTTTTTNTVSSLSVPNNVSINGRTVTWDVVNNADSYDVMINDQSYNVAVNQFVILDSFTGSTTIKVRAINTETQSDYSSVKTVVLTLQLAPPSNLSYTDNTISWDATEYSTGYVVNINGAEYMTTDLTYSFVVTEPTTIKVRAVGSTTQSILTSDYSEPIYLTVSLSAPTNITLNDGVISWNTVSNADGYQLVIGDTSLIDVSDTSYNIGYQFSGLLVVKVKAVDSTNNFNDSAFAQTTLNFPILTLNAPINVNISDGTLTFDPVDLATGYEIYLKGVLYTTITETTYSIPISILNDQSAYLEVKAISDVHQDSDLSVKVFVNLIAISNENDLLNMMTTGNYILTNNIILTSPWISKDFSGLFDGNGYTISGINIDSNFQNLGFFNQLTDASIKNLTLVGTINSVNTFNKSNIGGLAGFVSNSNINNVTVNIDITVESQNGVGNLGGVFGRIQNTNVSIVYYNGTITASNFITGGFAGKADNPVILSIIEKVRIDTTITLTGGLESYLGGFIGMLVNNSLQISECAVYADLTGTSYVGGFIGYLGSGKIINSYVTGQIEAFSLDIAHVGGFIGHLEGYNSYLENCIASVNVTESGTGAHLFYGGFSGYTVGGTFADVYHNCYYDALTSGIDRIGNATTGRGEGITSVSLSVVTTLNDFSSTIWDLTGSTPLLLWETH